MKLAVLIPDRGDRPKFLANCLRMLAAQTLQPDHIELVNDKPLSASCDITWRYRIGYDRLRDQGFDLIALIENDDWYAPEYLETMVREWQLRGKPQITGTNYTIYYHIGVRGYFTMEHFSRASAMNTFIMPDMDIAWPVDHEPYTDLILWKTLQGVPFRPQHTISMGIKHGEGLCGGRSHVDRLHRYTNLDPNFLFMKQVMGSDMESFKFYSSYYDNTSSPFQGEALKSLSNA